MDIAETWSANYASSCSPVAILLVTSGSKGDRVIFKYPDPSRRETAGVTHSNCYEVIIGEDYGLKKAYERPFEENRMRSFLSSAQNGELRMLDGLSDRLLAALLAVKIDLCGKPLMLHVNDVILASHPTLLTDVDAVPPYAEADASRRSHRQIAALIKENSLLAAATRINENAGRQTEEYSAPNSDSDDDFDDDAERYDIERALMTSAQLAEHYRSHFKHAIFTSAAPINNSASANAAVSSVFSPPNRLPQVNAAPVATGAKAPGLFSPAVLSNTATMPSGDTNPSKIPGGAIHSSQTTSSFAQLHRHALERRSINMFNVVFVLPANTTHVTSAYIRAYQQLSHRIALALWQEEKRSSFLTNQVKVLTTCKETLAMQNRVASSPSAATNAPTAASDMHNRNVVNSASAVQTEKVNSGTNAGPTANSISNANTVNAGALPHLHATRSSVPTPAAVFAATGGADRALSAERSACCDLQLRKSVLARSLRKVFHQACDSGIISDHSWTLLSFCLLPKIHCMPILTESTISRLVKSIMPYHTAVLLFQPKDRRTLLAQLLPLDASPTFDRIVQVMSPIKNFERIASDADVSLRHVLELAAHLVYWRRAVIITPVSEANRYVVRSSADVRVHSNLATEFSDAFEQLTCVTTPRLTLHHVLEAVSACVPLADLYDADGNEFASSATVALAEPSFNAQSPANSFINGGVDAEFPSSGGSAGGLLARSLTSAQQLVDVVTWLLQKRLIQQVHMFVTFVGESPLASREPPSTTKRNRPLPSNRNLELLSENDRKRVEAIPAAREEDFRTFQKLLPYFNGSSPIEDMMYLENLPRGKILHMLERFCDVLATCWHEDFRIASFN